MDKVKSMTLIIKSTSMIDKSKTLIDKTTTLIASLLKEMGAMRFESSLVGETFTKCFFKVKLKINVSKWLLVREDRIVIS